MSTLQTLTTVRAYQADPDRGLSAYWVEISSADYATREQAEDHLASWPKYMKGFVTACSRPIDDDYRNGSYQTYSVRAKTLDFSRNATTGNANEAVITRYRKSLSWLDANETFVWSESAYHFNLTRDELEARIALDLEEAGR